MTSPGWVLLLLAGGSSVALAAAALSVRARTRLHVAFSAGMLAFAVEASIAYALVARADTAEDMQFWLDALTMAGLLVPLPWAWFVTFLAHPASSPPPRRWRLGTAALSGVGVCAVGWLVAYSAFELSITPGPFYAGRLDAPGVLAVIVQLVATALLLGGLEVCLRTSRDETRWRIKHLLLGLGGIFLLRFYLLSQVLLFHVLMASYVTTGMATLFLGNLVIGASLARAQLRSTELSVSRVVVYRSVLLGVLGAYLLVVGALGWLLAHLGIPDEIFWGSLIVFVSAIGLASVLLSENVRWRVKSFIALNFYRTKYDYRAEWSSFTRRLGSRLTIDDLAPQILWGLTEAVGTNRGVLYLADSRDGCYHPAAVVEVDRALPEIPPTHPLVQGLEGHDGPVAFPEALGAASPGPRVDVFGAGSIALPLRWGDRLVGLALLGPERSGTAYGAEDLEFLRTVAEQAAVAVATGQLSETVAQSREFEAFHRLTSLVVHDLKNCLSSLSMLSQNALANFEDPEFQRDAIKTLSRTVERMRNLLGRLTSAPEATLSWQPVDLVGLLTELLEPLRARPGLVVETDLAPLPALTGDPEALFRVFHNLLTNAVEAMEGDGTLTLRGRREGPWVVVAIADTGCGISQEFLRKQLFAPFRSTKKGGWGIGLYHARGIVDAHGGRIEVVSQEGMGTTFTVRLPAEPPPR